MERRTVVIDYAYLFDNNDALLFNTSIFTDFG